jgi:hypothetical protein
VVVVSHIWCFVFKLSVQGGVEGCVSSLRAAAARKFHLLHLVGILFPHNIDDARSKPHQIVPRACNFIVVSFGGGGDQKERSVISFNILLLQRGKI